MSGAEAEDGDETRLKAKSNPVLIVCAPRTTEKLSVTWVVILGECDEPP